MRKNLLVLAVAAFLLIPAARATAFGGRSGCGGCGGHDAGYYGGHDYGCGGYGYGYGGCGGYYGGYGCGGYATGYGCGGYAAGYGCGSYTGGYGCGSGYGYGCGDYHGACGSYGGYGYGCGTGCGYYGTYGSCGGYASDPCSATSGMPGVIEGKGPKAVDGVEKVEQIPTKPLPKGKKQMRKKRPVKKAPAPKKAEKKSIDSIPGLDGGNIELPDVPAVEPKTDAPKTNDIPDEANDSDSPAVDDAELRGLLNPVLQEVSYRYGSTGYNQSPVVVVSR